VTFHVAYDPRDTLEWLHHSEIQKSPTLPTCPVLRTSSPGGETHCLAMCIVTGRSNPNWLMPSRRTAPATADATCGSNKSPTTHLLAFAPSGSGLAVVDTPGLGWCNGPLPSMRSADDDDTVLEIRTTSIVLQHQACSFHNYTRFQFLHRTSLREEIERCNTTQNTNGRNNLFMCSIFIC